MVAEKSTEPMTRYITSVVPLLKLTCDDACSRYVDLFLEREGSDSMADRLSQQTLLVFLVDDTDILPTLGHQRRDSHDIGLFADSEPIISAGAWLRAGSGVVRMDPLRFLAGCRTRRLNQV